MDKELIFKLIKKARRSQKNIIIPELCSDRSVLDVGCIGQDKDFNNKG
jgi:hypothetical protein